jgi:hypothetical protein
MRLSIALFTLVLTAQSLITTVFAQQDPIVDAIIKEARQKIPGYTSLEVFAVNTNHRFNL